MIAAPIQCSAFAGQPQAVVELKVMKSLPDVEATLVDSDDGASRRKAGSAMPRMSALTCAGIAIRPGRTARM